MFYQWGRKDPFTFATSSEQWGTIDQQGKYPVKIYTIDGVLIYQESNGSDNKDKQPIGGIIHSLTLATSMMEVIKNPIKSYYGNSAIISQNGHTKSLWDYYWTSYSRGIDGMINTSFWFTEPTRHNEYLDGYKSQCVKSIYDPCPYGYKLLSHGTFNDLRVTSGWLKSSYTGGSIIVINDQTWFSSSGLRVNNITSVGNGFWHITATSQSSLITYLMYANDTGSMSFYGGNNHEKSRSLSVRCIERVAKNCLKTVQKS